MSYHDTSQNKVMSLICALRSQVTVESENYAFLHNSVGLNHQQQTAVGLA